MKPIKLNDMPTDPCIECLVRPICTNVCEKKRIQIDWVKARYYGCQVWSVGKRRKNAEILIELREQNRKFDRTHPGYVYPPYKK